MDESELNLIPEGWNSILVSGEKAEVKYYPLEGSWEMFRHVNFDDCRQGEVELVLGKDCLPCLSEE